MTEPDVSFVVHGVDELANAFVEVVAEVEADAQKGFMPQHRYHGMGGIPFTGDTIELAAEQKGFVVSDGR